MKSYHTDEERQFLVTPVITTIIYLMYLFIAKWLCLPRFAYLTLGKYYPLVSGLSLTAGAKLVFGQDQDSYGGGFTQEQSFIGEMTGINFWDRVLGAAEISKLAESCEGDFKGNLLHMAVLGTGSLRGGVQSVDLTCEPSD